MLGNAIHCWRRSRGPISRATLAQNPSMGRRAVVPVLLSLVLVAAAVLKGYELASEPVAGTGLFDSRWFVIGLAEFELFFGLCWLLRWRPRRLSVSICHALVKPECGASRVTIECKRKRAMLTSRVISTSRVLTSQKLSARDLQTNPRDVS